MLFSNVTYDHEGLWRCSARNTIKGQERRNHSETVRIEVSGRPLARALVQGETRGVAVAVGEEAVLQLQFCSDPPPRQLAWEWGSLRLEEGRARGRFSASQRISVKRKDCYRAELTVREVARADERTYFLQVDNGSGTMRLGARLVVSDPVSMVTVLAVSISLLVIIVFCCICTAAMRRRHTCCFTEKRDLHTDNIRSGLGRGGDHQHHAYFVLLSGLRGGERRQSPRQTGSVKIRTSARLTNLSGPSWCRHSPDWVSVRFIFLL